jgi:hypothetical protein
MRPTQLAIAAFVASACSKSAPPAAADASAASTSAASIASAPAEGGASATEEAARQVVVAWSDALDRHDATALDQLYAPRVAFYGRDLPHGAVIDIKKRALRATPTFRQSIVGPISIVKEGDALTATFVKRSGGPPMRDVKARVVIANGHVKEESDEATDKRTNSARGAACESAASNAVATIPRVKKLLDDDRKQLASDPEGRMGGVGPIPNDDGGFSASLGVHHADRYEAQVWYTVDRAGKLTVTVLGEDVPVPPLSLASIERACKGAATGDAGD